MRQSRLALLLAGVVGAATLASPATAQAPLPLRGVAFDSLSSRPLPGAFITLNGIRSAFADDSGRFVFDSVAVGTHMLEMTHAVLDSIGLPGVAARVAFADGSLPVTLAVPSFATLWRAACGTRRAPADSGFVYGTVRSGRDGSEVAGAELELSWSDLTVVNIRRVTGRRYRSQTTSDGNGEYSICGVPIDAGMRVQATRGDLASTMIDLHPTNLRVIRRDLLLAPADTANATARGRIVGTVTQAPGGGAFEGATIVLDDVPQARTGADGRFSLPGVVAGTHQVEVLGIGSKPQLFIVDVLDGGEAVISAVLERVTTLDAVRVLGSPWQARMMEGIEARKQAAFARMIDSTEAIKKPSMGLMVSGINGVNVRPGRSSQDYTIQMRNGDGDPCTPNVRIDGIRSDIEAYLALGPNEIGLIEVYPRAASVPIDLQGGVSFCGLIVVWTKRILP